MNKVGTHRGKREVSHSDNPTQRYSSNKYTQPKNPYETLRRDRQDKLAMDRRRREYLEERRRRLEAMRRNPTEYRRQQARLRMEQRRSQSMSKSISVESKSVENSAMRNKNRKNISNEMRARRVKNRRRRRRRSKNCATKQPPYQWKTKNLESHELEQHKRNGNNRVSLILSFNSNFHLSKHVKVTCLSEFLLHNLSYKCTEIGCRTILLLIFVVPTSGTDAGTEKKSETLDILFYFLSRFFFLIELPYQQ